MLFHSLIACIPWASSPNFECQLVNRNENICKDEQGHKGKVSLLPLQPHSQGLDVKASETVSQVVHCGHKSDLECH